MNGDPAVLRLARIREASGLKDESGVTLTLECSDERDSIPRDGLRIQLAVRMEMAESQREADVTRFQLRRRHPRHSHEATSDPCPAPRDPLCDR